MRPWGSSMSLSQVLYYSTFATFNSRPSGFFLSERQASPILSEKSPAWLTILTQIVCLELGSYPLNKHSNQMPITSRFSPCTSFPRCVHFAYYEFIVFENYSKKSHFQNIDLNARDKDGQTALIFACKYGQCDNVKF